MSSRDLCGLKDKNECRKIRTQTRYDSYRHCDPCCRCVLRIRTPKPQIALLFYDKNRHGGSYYPYGRTTVAILPLRSPLCVMYDATLDFVYFSFMLTPLILILGGDQIVLLTLEESIDNGNHSLKDGPVFSCLLPLVVGQIHLQPLCVKLIAYVLCRVFLLCDCREFPETRLRDLKHLKLSKIVISNLAVFSLSFV